MSTKIYHQIEECFRSFSWEVMEWKYLLKPKFFVDQWIVLLLRRICVMRIKRARNLRQAQLTRKGNYDENISSLIQFFPLFFYQVHERELKKLQRSLCFLLKLRKKGAKSGRKKISEYKDNLFRYFLTTLYWVVLKRTVFVFVRNRNLLGSCVFGDSLSSLRNGVFREFTGKEESDGRLDLPRRDRRLLVDLGQHASLKCNRN